MKLMTGWTTIDAPGGKLPAYEARPAAAKGALPGVVVIHEAWGVDGHIEDIAHRFAEAGYHALAPDLYARGGRRPAEMAKERMEAVKRFVDEAGPMVFRDPLARDAALAKKPESERKTLGETFALLSGVLGQSHALADLVQAAAAHLHGEGRKVGATGFCMGGGLAGLLAVNDPRLAAAAAWYGMPPPADKLGAMNAAFLGLYGGPQKDPRVTGTVPAFEQAAKAAGKRVECRVYEQANHAFFNDTRPSYDPEAARDAWARVLALFARELA